MEDSEKLLGLLQQQTSQIKGLLEKLSASELSASVVNSIDSHLIEEFTSSIKSLQKYFISDGDVTNYYYHLFNAMPFMICVIDSSCKILKANQTFCGQLGLLEVDLIGKPLAEFLVDKDMSFITDNRSSHIEGRVAMVEKNIAVSNGHVLSTVLTCAPIQTRQPIQPDIICVFQDLQSSLLMQESMRRFSDVLAATTDFVGTMTIEGNPIYINKAGREMIGLCEHEPLPSLGFRHYHPPWALDIIERIGIPAAIKEGVWSGETAFLNLKTGCEVPVSMVLVAHKLTNGKTQYISTLSRDLSKVKAIEEKLIHIAQHDALTGLPNRLQFESMISNKLASAARHQHKVAILFTDLNGFKKINDHYGHQAGDALLREVAKRLKGNLRSEDFIARIGGDEFAIILNEITNTHVAGIFAQKLLNSLNDPFYWEKNRLFIKTSIGIACYPNDGDKVPSLLKSADIAMYRAKELGDNRYQYSTAELHRKHSQRLGIENALRAAIKKNEFYLLYQPIFSIPSLKMMGAEALLRWQHEDFGVVLPEEFIQIAEDTGLIVPIGEWVFHRACEQFSKCFHSKNDSFHLAINLSAYQLERGDLLHAIPEILLESKLALNKLELEVTEHVVMSDSDRPERILRKLHDMGVNIAIDDFGTGYSSLRRLKSLPLNTLKIDRSFVKGIGHCDEDEVIIKSIILLAEKLGLSTTAEGIETKGQLQFLVDNSCPRAQGTYLSEPMNIQEMNNYIKRLGK